MKKKIILKNPGNPNLPDKVVNLYILKKGLSSNNDLVNKLKSAYDMLDPILIEAIEELGETVVLTTQDDLGSLCNLDDDFIIKEIDCDREFCIQGGGDTSESILYKDDIVWMVIRG
jgi:hypothetical protein